MVRRIVERQGGVFEIEDDPSLPNPIDDEDGFPANGKENTNGRVIRQLNMQEAAEWRRKNYTI